MASALVFYATKDHPEMREGESVVIPIYGDGDGLKVAAEKLMPQVEKGWFEFPFRNIHSIELDQEGDTRLMTIRYTGPIFNPKEILHYLNQIEVT